MKISAHFSRLPESVRQTVLDELDREVTDSFAILEKLNQNSDTRPEEIRAVEGDIVRASELRSAFTGE
ncbi:hypothetical protein [Leucobacter musarum]|uniref:hypothetical protein n=1 Tax=Leucobacter musarum TaxID=1930747 RepID=UPI0006A78487|nr:hypothetical protein [Leucobacter musarum]